MNFGTFELHFETIVTYLILLKTPFGISTVILSLIEAASAWDTLFGKISPRLL